MKEACALAAGLLSFGPLQLPEDVVCLAKLALGAGHHAAQWVLPDVHGLATAITF